MGLQKPKLPLPSRSLVRVGIYVAVLGLVGLALIQPNVEEDKRLDEEIRKVGAEIEEQKILHPFYRELEAQLAATPYGGLPIPSPKEAGQEQIFEVTGLIGVGAVRAGYEAAVVPAPATLTDENGLMLLNCAFKGDFTSFRDLYLAISAVPYVRHIEHLRVFRGPEGNVTDMKIWIAVKKH